MPRPRLHLIRFHGVLAPNAKLRSLVVPQGPPKDEEVPGVGASGVQCAAETVQVRPARISWARLLKRVFELDLEHCPNCGGELKIIAAILEQPVIEKILQGKIPRWQTNREIRSNSGGNPCPELALPSGFP